MVSLGLLLLAGLSALSQTTNSKPAPASSAKQQPQGKAVHATRQRDGNEIFAQNCSRCHSAPEGFSPRISGTVVRHMRVRANLSREDEQALLRFFNP